jgi:hypothetical protein
MTALRRTTTPRAMPMSCLELNGVCNECGQYRAHGNHRSCSKKRQQRYAQARKGNE